MNVDFYQINFHQRIVRMFRIVLAMLTIVAIFSLTKTPCIAGDELHSPIEYICTKLKKNDIVLLGTTHKKPDILGFIAELIPSLRGIGVTHIGLEIPSDQQDKIDAYMATGIGLDQVRFHPQIDCPEYRHLLQVVRETGGLQPVAIDLPYSKHGGSVSRDEWMADQLLKVLDSGRQTKIFVIVGNLHIFKKLEWEKHVPDQHPSIREFIIRKKPATKMWSVGQLIDGNPDECDFTRRFSSLPDAVALDLDERYQGWKLGLTSPIAIMPAECFELLDGVIVY